MDILLDTPPWVFTVIAALVSVFGAFVLQRVIAFRNASVKFRAAVLDELGSIYPLPANWPEDIDAFLRAAFSNLQVAVAEFRPFVPRWRRRAFDRAWSRYRNTYARAADVQVYHHYDERFLSVPNAKAAFRHNVDVLLSFAE